MLDRRPTSDPEVVEVTFRLPVEVGAEVVHVVGDFNSWSREATPLRRDDGGFSVTLELQAGTTYQFRYLLDGHVWENDWAADDYVGNEFGGENSLLDLSDGAALGGGAAPPDAGSAHGVGAIDEPGLAAGEEALAVDALATEAQTVSEAASGLTPVAEGGLAVRPAAPPKQAEKDRTPAKASKGADSKSRSKGRSKVTSGDTTAGSKDKGKDKSKGKGKPKSSGRSKGSSTRGTASDGSATTKAELLEQAKELDISGRSKMNKDELEKAVAAARKR